MANNENILFSEVQRVSPFFSIIMGGVMILVIVAVISFAFSRLETQVREDGIYVRYYPVHRSFRHYGWDQIEKAYVRNYSPMSDYGGWGLKGVSDDKVMSVSGKTGLQLHLKGGKKLLIGTQRPEEIKVILTHLGKNPGP